MPKDNLYQGRDYAFRNGTGDFYWKGMATKQDPESQAPDHPRLVVNGRYIGGHIISRPPLNASAATIPLQTGLDFTDASWELAFVGKHHSYSGLKLWWGASFSTGTYPGGTFGYVDTDADPEHNEIAVHYQTQEVAPVLVYYGGFIYAGATGALRRLYRITQAPGVVSPVPVRLPSDEVVISAPDMVIGPLHVHDGILYYLLSGGATALLYSWDGFQKKLEYTFTTAGTSGASICSFQEKVVVAVRGEGHITIRAADGTWSDVTVGGFNCSGYINSMAQLKDKLYIASGAAIVYSFDGTTLAVARTATAGTTPGALNCLCAFNGRLYYTWKETLGGSEFWPWLGIYDPDTVDASYQWKDDYVSLGLGAEFKTVTDAHSIGTHHHAKMAFGSVTALAVYRQRLWAAVSKKSAGLVEDSQIMTHTVVNNPYSTWFVTHDLAGQPIPANPIYFEKQLAATGVDDERIIKYFKVL